MTEEQFRKAVDFLKRGRIKQLQEMSSNQATNAELAAYGSCILHMFGYNDWLRVVNEADLLANEEVDA